MVSYRFVNAGNTVDAVFTTDASSGGIYNFTILEQKSRVTSTANYTIGLVDSVAKTGLSKFKKQPFTQKEFVDFATANSLTLTKTIFGGSTTTLVA